MDVSMQEYSIVYPPMVQIPSDKICNEEKFPAGYCDCIRHTYG